MEECLQKCFICDADIQSNEKCIGTHWSKSIILPISKILEKCIQQLFDEADEQYFCFECIKRMQEYDQLVQLSQQIENDLFDAYQRKSLNNYFIVDDEPDYEQDTRTENIAELSGGDGVDDETDYDKICANDIDDCMNKIDNNSMDTKNVELIIEYVPQVTTPPTANRYVVQELRKRGRPKKGANEELKNVNNHKENRSQRLRKLPTNNLNCERCDISFRNKIEQREHNKTMHANKQWLVCDICGQRYKSKGALDIHVGMHKGVSPHECEICGKKFTQKGALVRHMPLHTGERPYQCDKCGKQFIHYSSFHMHQLVHNNIREKKCDICGLELRSNSHLNRHLRVHSGEKPYACPICGQKFAQRYNMTTHLKAHQGIHRVHSKNHICPICNEAFNRQEKLNGHLANQHGTVATTSIPTNTDSKISMEKGLNKMLEIKTEEIMSTTTVTDIKLNQNIRDPV